MIKNAFVLIVDDDDAVRSSIAEILRRAGYAVAEAETGEAALPHLLEDPVDVVLLDVRMPGMSGLTVLDKIKQIAPDVMVVMMTAYADKHTIYDALRHNRAYDLLEKPMPPDRIMAVIADAVTRRVAARHFSTETEPDESDRDMPRIIAGAGLLLDLDRAEAYAGTNRLPLTRSEFWLLAVLVHRRERLLTPSDLVRLVQGYHVDEASARDIIRPLISRLRKKLDTANVDECIINVRGEGYMFSETVTGAA